ncbi:hypothetical protein ACFFQW_02980 [Umezawaea endophytica]|uniref:Uncharacterized protein n=1 Tax=Umezawaea endophytica TaxID=1654476 RepID=A0A9X2VM31_9PSEU|nr:hypothetical protein [Umezawaea endophytica]MCS7479110.1 hypothetical protein [Umezawaea endophytica]
MSNFMDIPTPPWTLQNYVHLLDVLVSREIRTVTIQEYDCGGEGVWLRHDVEVDLHAAVAMARVEAERGVRAHYFICAASPLVAGQERLSRTVADELRSLGHVVGVHVLLEPFATFDERLARDRVLVGVDVDGDASIHAPGVHAAFLAKIESARRVYRRLVSGGPYYSDSTGSWRRSDPADLLVSGTPGAQLLTHPYWWSKGIDTSPHHATGDLEIKQFMPQLYSRISND